MRELGAALATNITYVLNMVLCELACYQKPEIRRCLVWPDASAFQGLKGYLKIGIPGALMLCFEWWCFELLAIFSGLISVEALAAEVVVVNLVTFIFMIPLGTSYAASALTGYFLGEGKIEEAKRYSRLAIVFNVIITSFVVLLVGTFQTSISNIFTQEEKVVTIIRDIIYVLLVYIWFDTIHGVQSGIIRGLGRQAYGSVFTLICYYLIGLPMALYFAFYVKMGVKGLWLGFTIACIILDIGFWMIINCPDWYLISTQMREKVRKEGATTQVKQVEGLDLSISNQGDRSPAALALKREFVHQHNKSPVLGSRPKKYELKEQANDGCKSPMRKRPQHAI